MFVQELTRTKSVSVETQQAPLLAECLCLMFNVYSSAHNITLQNFSVRGKKHNKKRRDIDILFREKAGQEAMPYIFGKFGSGGYLAL